jgi:PAS domain S-box-containing protein
MSGGTDRALDGGIGGQEPRVEKEASMSQLLFQALASAADGAFVVDQDQHIMHWNQAAEKLLGHTPNEVLGHPCYERINGRDGHGRAICRKGCPVVTAALADRQVPAFELSVHSKAGELTWIDISTFVLPANGSHLGPVVVHLFRNITKNKKNEQLLREVLSAADRLRERGPFGAPPQAIGLGPSGELTDRELEVVGLLVQGLSTAEMAQALCISTSTVRNHIRNIMSKFQVHSRLEAAVHALKHRLVRLE